MIQHQDDRRAGDLAKEGLSESGAHVCKAGARHGGKDRGGGPGCDPSSIEHGGEPESTERTQSASPAIDPGEARAMRMWYAEQFKLTSAFLGVAQLAAILDMAPSTIYTLMRAGTFFLPQRMLGGALKVWIDDLVAWHLSGADKTPAYEKRAPRSGAASAKMDGGSGAAEGRALSQAEVNKAVSKAAEEALLAAGIDPARRRRQRPR